MPTINFEQYPYIGQTNPRFGCIPVNIENVLKYFNENNYNERFLLEFYAKNNIPLSFDQALPYLENLLPHFEFIFKKREDFEGSTDIMVKYLKENIDKKTPVLVSFEAGGGAHIRTLIEYNKTDLIFFDPGDCQKKRFNCSNDQFKNALRIDYHTLVIKPRK